MTAKYDFKTSPDIQGDKEQATLYPQLVVSGTKDLTDLAKEIARRSTIKEGTVMGLFCDLENIIANYLADGYNVKLGELGTLSATLTCRKVADKREIRAASVHFDNVKFKPTGNSARRYVPKVNWNAQNMASGVLPPNIRKKNALHY